MSKTGKRNFDTCKVKAISSKGIRGAASKLEVSAVDCPRIQDDGVTFDESLPSYFFSRRYRDLRRSVAQYVCEGCIYPQMSPTEVAETRIELASKELERLSLVEQITAVTEDH